MNRTPLDRRKPTGKSATARTRGDDNSRSAWITGSLGLAGVVIASVLTYLAATGHATPNPSTGEDAAAVSVDEPPGGGARLVSTTDSYTGTVQNLQAGQSVWLFARQESIAPSSWRPKTYVAGGPCAVADGRWTCRLAALGPANPKGTNNYTVWATVLTAEDASRMVQLLRGLGPGDPAVLADYPAAPPHVARAVDSVTVRTG